MEIGVGDYYRLDPNMTFKKRTLGQEDFSYMDSGSWAIKDQNTLVLKSAKTMLYFDVLKTDSFYFFIPPFQRQEFVNDLKITTNKLKNAKPFMMNDKIITAAYMVGFSLSQEYLAKEISSYSGY